MKYRTLNGKATGREFETQRAVAEVQRETVAYWDRRRLELLAAEFDQAPDELDAARRSHEDARWQRGIAVKRAKMARPAQRGVEAAVVREILGHVESSHLAAMADLGYLAELHEATEDLERRVEFTKAREGLEPMVAALATLQGELSARLDSIEPAAETTPEDA